MSEDVFRIFRQTGRRIALIKQQVERERCTYLKDSYTEKNQLYKELAGIFHSKKATKNPQGTDVLSATPSQGKYSRGIHEEKANEAGHCNAHRPPKDLRSINVNVLKRCECCRRRAFRKVDDNDDDDDAFDEEAFQSESQNPDANDKAKTKPVRKISQVSKSGTSESQGRKISQVSKYGTSESAKGKKEHSKGTKHKTKLVQFSRYDDVRIPATAQSRVQAGIWALKKQNSRPRDPQSKQQSKSVRFESNGSATSLPREVKAASETNGGSATSLPREVKAASVTPGLTAAIPPRPTLKSRASIKLESQLSSRNEKLRLEGNAWTSHLQNVQEKKTNSSSTVTGLSKAYCAFKKLLNKMEEDYVAEQQAQEDEEFRAESRGAAELPGSRPASDMSRSDSRWVPLRRSSDTLSIRLNTWTMGSLEPASMDSFRENSEEEEELGLDTGHGENDDDSLHEIFILKQSSQPSALKNRDYSR